MKIFFFSVILTGMFIAFNSCNPDCENFARINATITPRFDLQEGGFLLKTSPTDYLQDREIYIEKIVSGTSNYTQISATSIEDGYLLNKVDVTEGGFNFFVKDNDCGGFLPLNTIINCEILAQVQTEISPKILVPGQEILIRTTPENFIQNRELYVQKSVNGKLMIDENTPISSEFSAEAGGRIATIPRDAIGNTDIFIRDKQCGGFVSLQTVQVADQVFMDNNLAFFASPATSSIILPSPPSIVPTNISNTWFSPVNRNYCIWFVPQKELVDINNSGDSCFKEKSVLQPGDVSVGPDNQPASGSWEIKTPGCESEDPLAFLYDGNPLTGGVIDTLSGYVSFEIDRTSKGLGKERYEGSLIDPSKTDMPDNFKIVGACEPESAQQQAKLMMVVTSELTGRQLILFRFDLKGLEAVHGKPFCKPE